MLKANPNMFNTAINDGDNETVNQSMDGYD